MFLARVYLGAFPGQASSSKAGHRVGKSAFDGLAPVGEAPGGNQFIHAVEQIRVHGDGNFRLGHKAPQKYDTSSYQAVQHGMQPTARVIAIALRLMPAVRPTQQIMAATAHPAFEAPPDVNTPVWRFMPFTKYVAMLQTGALFFARSDLLGDPFEGSYARANEALRPEVYKDQIPADALKRFSDFSKWLRQWTFINCWHCNQSESAAMWKSYAATVDAVAVRSTFAVLRDALPADAFIGAVHYIDYDKQWLPEGNAFYPFLHKRLSFENEREVRAILQQHLTKDLAAATNTEPGRLVPVDLRRVIETVLVAPSAANWFLELVGAVTAKYGLQAPVVRSRLDDAPFF